MQDWAAASSYTIRVYPRAGPALAPVGGSASAAPACALGGGGGAGLEPERALLAGRYGGSLDLPAGRAPPEVDVTPPAFITMRAAAASTGGADVVVQTDEPSEARWAVLLSDLLAAGNATAANLTASANGSSSGGGGGSVGNGTAFASYSPTSRDLFEGARPDFLTAGAAVSGLGLTQEVWVRFCGLSPGTNYSLFAAARDFARRADLSPAPNMMARPARFDFSTPAGAATPC